MSDVRYEALAQALGELEQAMLRHQLWSNTPPDDAALHSTEPFSLDTLTFEQWLQFIMHPRFEYLIQYQQPLPAKCEVFPMAEQVWGQAYQDIQRSIKQIDDVITLGKFEP